MSVTTTRPAPAGPPAAPSAPARPSYGELVARLRAAQKTTKGAPLYSRLVNRPLGRRLAALAHLAHLTPNQVTGLSALCTAAGIAVVALARPVWWVGLVVGALLVLGYALDAADGQLARLRGGGSKAGEWLDHVVDAAKIASLHLAVAVGAFRAGVDERWLLAPLAFSALASTWFFAIILNDHLRRLAGAGDGQAAVAAGEGRRHPLWRSLLALPADYGGLCALFLLVGAPALFRPAYLLLLAGFAVIALASLVRWYRDAAALDGAVRPAGGAA